MSSWVQADIANEFDGDMNWERTGPRSWRRVRWVECKPCKGSGHVQVRHWRFWKRDARCEACNLLGLVRAEYVKEGISNGKQ